MENNKSLRIPLDSNNITEKYINVKLEQDYDFLETLSLELDLKDAYKSQNSDWGVVVGRCQANGVGIPNVKISIFIEQDSNDNTLIKEIYPYSTINTTNVDDKRYNLLPSEQQSSCHRPVGSFFSKRTILDNEIVNVVFDKYYKYSTVTNNAGDFMIFGIPTGTYNLHCEFDISDIGYLSQYPYDLISQGYAKTLFETPTKYKTGTNLNSLPQIISQDISVTVYPFWSNVTDDIKEAGITKSNIEIDSFSIKPMAFFMGSAITDSDHNALARTGRPYTDTGKLDQMETSEGKITILRETVGGSFEEITIDGGRNIDGNGAWCFQIPMNLDYKVTDEYGNLIDSEDPNKGIPTRAKVRFKIELDDNDANTITTAKYLVPNNPSDDDVPNFSFDETVPDSFFAELKWNKIYSVKNFITRYQKRYSIEDRKFVGLKSLNESSANLNAPFNKVDTINNPFFSVLCILTGIIVDIIKVLNPVIKTLGGSYIYIDCQGIRYKPSCKTCNPVNGDSGSATDLKNCIGSNLAQSMQIFSFDFYNDWLNGTLYFPKFKYKINNNIKSNFCNFDYGDNVGDVSYNGRIVNMCQFANDGPDTGYAISRKRGLIKYNIDNDEFFYTPVLIETNPLNNDPVKLPFLRSDIICLGSVKNCDIDNIPKFYDKLKATSFNKSPLIKEEAAIGETLTSSGTTDYTLGLVGFNTSEALVLNLGCVNTYAEQNMCTNLNRLCELSVGVAESGTTLIDDSDIENFVGRRLFMYANGMTGGTLTGSFYEQDYDNFRNIYDYSTLKFSSTLGNSLYFYFGLKQGKTSLDLLKNNYLTDCKFIPTDSYYLLLSVKTDSKGISNIINVDINGGNSPYILDLFSTNGTDSQFITSAITNGVSPYNFTGLTTGTYKVVCYDASNSIVTKSIYVPGVSTLDFTVSTLDSTRYDINDGKIIINNIFNGISPYNIIVSSTTVNDTYTISGNSYTISNLYNDTYYITITDNNLSSKTKKVILNTAQSKLELNNVLIVPKSCSTGYGKFEFNIIGGNYPYKIFFEDEVYTTIPSYFGVDEGTYNITIVDNNTGQTLTTGFTINTSLFNVNFHQSYEGGVSGTTAQFSGGLGGSYRNVNLYVFNDDIGFYVETTVIGTDSFFFKTDYGNVYNYEIIDNNSGCGLSSSFTA